MSANPKSSAHFRILFPRGLKGRKHSGHMARVFVTLPGFPETELPSVIFAETGWYIDDVTAITFKLCGSIEVEYSDE